MASMKKRRLSRNLKRAAKVAIGAGSLYLAGRGLKQVSDAAESGNIVALVKGIAKLSSVRSLGETGVQSLLDGLKGEDDTGEDDTEE